MKEIRFGIIGGGLMGREAASAMARWCHLTDMDVKPVLTGLCSRSESTFGWYKQNFASTLAVVTQDYRELLASDAVDAVYIAVPHDLHQEFYCDAIEAGKHLFGEKPFGIDKTANDAINACIDAHPDVFVRCCSQFPFFPAVQRIGSLITSGALGQIIEVETGFKHSSDLDTNKAINWKRMIEFNGEYGVLGDLGMHACHVPFRAGWRPRNVRAVLSDIVKQRPDGKGNVVPCKTWDNGTLLCEMQSADGDDAFPWTFKAQRIAPGEKNSWYVNILGTKTSVRFSTKSPRRLELMEYTGGEQVWGQIDMGMDTAYKTISGGIFEFGFGDAIQQMWAGFCYELHHGKPITPFGGCVTPDEVALSHRLFTAALESQRDRSVVAV